MNAGKESPPPQDTAASLQRILNEVVFASVLFFGGIARAFDSRLLRIVLASLAMLFLGTLIALPAMPICHE